MGRNSANILSLGWLITLLGVVGLGLTLTLDLSTSAKVSNYVSGNCLTGKSYYGESDLTENEKKQFSSNAVAIDAIGTSQKRYRLVIDYLISGVSRDNLETKVFLSADEPIKNFKYQFLLNSTVQEENKVSGDLPFFYQSKDYRLNSAESSIGVAYYLNDKCEFSVQDLVLVSKSAEYGKKVTNWSKSEVALSNFESKELELNPGENFISFSDWVSLEDLIRKGLKVQFFSPKQNRWLNLQKASAISYPGRVYRVNNPSSTKLKIAQPAPFRVPNDLNKNILEQGWNLIEIDESDASKSKFYANPDPINLIATQHFSINELIAAKKITSLFKVENGKKSELNIANHEISISSGRYWLHLNNESNIPLKMPNIVLSVEGGGNTISSHQVPLKLIVENKDDSSHFVVSSNHLDPCQIGIRVRDKSGKIITDDFSGKVCPLWPSLAELKVNEKKEYNYLWVVPKNIKGDFVIEAYFNYSRLSGNRIIKTSSITLK